MFSADLGVQAAAASTGTQFLAVTSLSFAPYIQVYPWTSSGFGAKFANPSVPATNASPARGCAFTPSGNALAVIGSGNSDPKTPSSWFVEVYPWSSSGFGTKFSVPVSPWPSGEGQKCTFSPNGSVLLGVGVSLTSSDGQKAYSWSGSGYVGPFAFPVGGIRFGYDCDFHPSGNAIAVAHDSAPRITVWAWSGAGFGAKFTDPTTLPTNRGNGCRFSPSGDALAVAHATSPFITVYPWSGSGFGAKFTNPATLPPGEGLGCAFHPSGNALAVAHPFDPWITVYPWSSSGFGTKFSNPASPVGSQSNQCAFSPDGAALVIANNATPSINAYAWSNSGFGTKFADPSILPGGSASACAFGVIP